MFPYIPSIPWYHRYSRFSWRFSKYFDILSHTPKYSVMFVGIYFKIFSYILKCIRMFLNIPKLMELQYYWCSRYSEIFYNILICFQIFRDVPTCPFIFPYSSSCCHIFLVLPDIIDTLYFPEYSKYFDIFSNISKHSVIIGKIYYETFSSNLRWSLIILNNLKYSQIFLNISSFSCISQVFADIKYSSVFIEISKCSVIFVRIYSNIFPSMKFSPIFLSNPKYSHMFSHTIKYIFMFPYISSFSRNHWYSWCPRYS